MSTTSEEVKNIRQLTVAKITFIKKVTTKYGDSFLFGIHFNEMAGSATFFSKTDDCSEFNIGDSRTFELTESEGKKGVKLIPKVKRNAEREEKIQIIGEAIRCALDLYKDGKITFNKVGASTDYFRKLIEERLDS